MAKKRDRNRKTTVYAVMEGKRERIFLDYLIELYNPKSNNINITPSPIAGGSPEHLINDALKNLNYKKVFVWLDADTPIDDRDPLNIYSKLEKTWNLKNEIDRNTPIEELQEKYNSQMRNPILIVSTPLSVEGVIIRLFDKKIPEMTEALAENKIKMKNSVSGIFGSTQELEYYRDKLSRESLEGKTTKIKELELILSFFTSS